MASLWDRIRTPLVVLAGAAILALTFGRGTDPLSKGAHAPALEVDTSAGVVRLGDPGVTVVNFWRSDCPPCRAEVPVLSRAHARLAAQGGRIVGLSADGVGLGEALASARRLGMRYPIGVATDDVLVRFRVDRFPTTYVVAPGGRIAASFVGAVDEDLLEGAVRQAR